MSARAALFALAASAWLLPAGACRAGSTWAAGVGAAQVWTDNVFGTESSPGDGITDGRGWLLWTPAQALQLGAAGRLVRFRDNPALDHGTLRSNLDLLVAGQGARTHWFAGVAGNWRINDDLYAPYDFREGAAYVAAKRYLTPVFTAQLRADGSARAYPDSPWEDAAKVWLATRLQRSFPSRTSLGAGVRAGWKRYRTGSLEDAAAWEASAQVAQSLSTRTAARAWWATSELWQYGDQAAQLAAFDNPLLDEFSADGTRLGAALRVILPWNCVADLSGELAWLRYPGRPPALYDPLSNLFLVTPEDRLALSTGARTDESAHARLDLEKRLAAGPGGARVSLRVAVEWTDQDSNDLYWAWDGWSAQAAAAIEY